MLLRLESVYKVKSLVFKNDAYILISLDVSETKLYSEF